MAHEAQRLFSIVEATQLLSLGRTKLGEEIDSGRLDAVRVGRRVLIPAQAINDYIAALPRTATGR